jgi:hypothetical protein
MYCKQLKVILLNLFILLNFDNVSTKKVDYPKQFPDGSEHLPLPSIVAYSIHVGPIFWTYLPFTMESIRLNPGVQFVLISIMDADSKNPKILRFYEKSVSNFHIHTMATQDFNDLVYRKLGITISVNVSRTWFNKICDYKPTLAYLFPEYLDTPEKMKLNIKKPPEFWGYVDVDLVWGNISRFSHLFYENTVVRAGFKIKYQLQTY